MTRLELWLDRLAAWLETQEKRREQNRPIRPAELMLMRAELEDVKTYVTERLDRLHMQIDQLIVTRWLSPEDVKVVWDSSLADSLAEPGVFEEEEEP